MTPEELAKSIDSKIACNDYSVKSEEVLLLEITELIKQAKSEWCEEQREICSDTYWNKLGKNSVTFLILNAPEPKQEEKK